MAKGLEIRWIVIARVLVQVMHMQRWLLAAKMLAERIASQFQLANSFPVTVIAPLAGRFAVLVILIGLPCQSLLMAKEQRHKAWWASGHQASAAGTMVKVPLARIVSSVLFLTT